MPMDASPNRGRDTLRLVSPTAEPVPARQASEPPLRSSREAEARAQISHHILGASGTMVGICMAMVGLVKVTETHFGPSSVDELAAIAAAIFLVSALSSYFSLRHAGAPARARKFEMAADIVFMAGLIFLTGITGLLAYEIV